MNNKYIVIMAGGRGERFWPQSRLSKPKHLLPIVGNDSMLTQTLNRIKNIVPPSNIFIITNKEQHQAVIETAAHSIPPNQIIAEPIGKDTAAAIALAKVLIKQRDPSAAFAILPADHVITDVQNLEKCLNFAFETALNNDVLITIGIPPTFPSTAYGYIQKGDPFDTTNTLFVVNKFVEKPNIETAKQYLDSGNYFWNAGMFIWSVPSLESALSLHCPELSQTFLHLETQLNSNEDLYHSLKNTYEKLPKISIDYALLEKAKNVVTIPSSFDWDDVGEWPAIERHFPPSQENNIIRGNAVLHHSTNNIIINEGDHLTALIGVDNLIVVHTKDATLICHKDNAQDIKHLLKKIQDNPQYQHLL